MIESWGQHHCFRACGPGEYYDRCYEGHCGEESFFMLQALENTLENRAELAEAGLWKSTAEAPVHSVGQHQNGCDQAAKPEYATNQMACSEMTPA